MNFDEWYKSRYNGNDEGFKMHLESAWDAALVEAEGVVTSHYDENEPWLETGEITKLVNIE